MAKRRRSERPEKYVKALHEARRQLAEARVGLARTTTPEGAISYVDSEWQWAQRLVDNRTSALLRNPNVVGLGLGSKIIDGRNTGEICLTIFVSRKLTEDSLQKRKGRRLPKSLREGKRRLPVDVVQIGTLKRQAFAGQSCSVSNGTLRTGTIGAPAVTPAGEDVFITAMHVTGLSHLPAGGATLEVNAPSTRDFPSAPVIGRVIEGTRKGIDAAKVLITAPHKVLREIPEVGRIRGWRPLAFPGDMDIPVMMFGATSQMKHTGFIVNPSSFVPGFGLDSAITVSGFDTVGGDSGAALVDRQLIVLGFLVGEASDGLRIFCPASLVLQRLGCDIPTIVD
jgi:hypothetical protein